MCSAWRLCWRWGLGCGGLCEALVERGDGEGGTDGEAAFGELELLGVAPEPEREFSAGVAFALQAIDEAPRLRSCDARAVREGGLGGEELRARGGAERLQAPGEHGADDAARDGGLFREVT